MGIEGVNPFELPLLNTIILLSSGVTITYAHHSLIQGNRKGALYGTVFTILLAIVFTGLQGLEYTVSSFTISDSVYGSCFYFGTGFHGLHVIIGTIFFYLINFNSIGKKYDFKSTGSSIKFVLINKNNNILYLNQ